MTTSSLAACDNSGMLAPAMAEGAVEASRHAGYRPFPSEALPSGMRRHVEQSADALGCDPAAVALPALAAFAALVGNTRVLQLKGTWSEPCVLWTAVVGEPGSLKSAALQQAAGFMLQQQRQLLTLPHPAAEEHREALRVYH